MSDSEDEQDEREQEIYLKNKVKEKRSEVAALKRELKGLTRDGNDLREIFAAERSRSASIPKYWFLIMITHLLYSLNEWHALRSPSKAIWSGGPSYHFILFSVHLAMFLLYWRRFYFPEKRFTLPLSVWIFIVSWYRGI